MFQSSEIVFSFFKCIINIALPCLCPHLYWIAQFIPVDLIRSVTINSPLVECLNVYCFQVYWIAGKKNINHKELWKKQRKVRKRTSSYSSNWKNISRKKWTRTSFKLFLGSTTTVSWTATLDYEAVVESMTNLENSRSRVSYTKFTDVDRFQIARYAGENGSK